MHRVFGQIKYNSYMKGIIYVTCPVQVLQYILPHWRYPAIAWGWPIMLFNFSVKEHFTTGL